MNHPIAIRTEGLSKVYKVYASPLDRLKEAVSPVYKQYHKDFHALHNISFQIEKGETVGILGTNGSGKSTLLKLITGVLQPTAGTIQVNGRVAAILELGAGFNPEYTGTENIYLNGTLLGMSRKEIESKISEIIAFAEIGEFMDRPVKYYSSGMFARLAFAVAINVDPDILIVDEALSVGDTKFQMKCIERMKLIRESGTTILFVSHAIEQIKRFCTKAIWIEKGELKEIGEANTIVNQYEDYLHLKISEENMSFGSSAESNEEINDGVAPESNSDKNQMTDKIGLIQSVNIERPELNTFDALHVEVKYKIFTPKVSNFLVGVAIYDRDRKYIFGPNTYLDKIIGVPNTQGEHTISYKIPKIPLLSGTYYVDVGIFSDEGLVYLDYRTSAAAFTVQNEYFTEGLVHMEHEWRVLN